MIYHPDTFASKIFLPLLHDLSAMMRAAGISVSIAALDLSASPQPPDDFLWDSLSELVAQFLFPTVQSLGFARSQRIAKAVFL